MQVVILAGGLGSRLSEETKTIPKPLVEIGGKPIIWHIMKYFSTYGYNDFIVCLGYKGELIKEYFLKYNIYNSNLRINLKENSVISSNNNIDNWNINLVDTGINTLTSLRLKKIQKYLKKDKNFFFTYADGLSNINLNKLYKSHLLSKKIITVSLIKRRSRFGIFQLNEKKEIISFGEKNYKKNEFLNGGFFCISNDIFKYITNKNISWEEGPLFDMTRAKKINPFIHNGFWQCMDTLNDKNLLEKLWKSQKAEWRIW